MISSGYVRLGEVMSRCFRLFLFQIRSVDIRLIQIK
jgi:hypothetical protein